MGRSDVKVVMSVDDGVTKEIKKADRAVDKLGKSGKSAGDRLKKAFSGKLKAAIGAVVAAFAVTTVVRTISDTADQLERIGLLADSIGATAEEVSGLKFALESRGIGDDIEQVLNALESARGAALRDALSGQAEAFGRIGIKVSELRQLNTAALFTEIANSLNVVGNQYEQAAVAQQIFGEDSRKLIPLLRDGGEELEHLKQQAQQFGAVFGKSAVEDARQFKQEVREIGAKWDAVITKLTVQLLPALTAVLDKMSDLVAYFEGLSFGDIFGLTLDDPIGSSNTATGKSRRKGVPTGSPMVIEAAPISDGYPSGFGRGFEEIAKREQELLQIRNEEGVVVEELTQSYLRGIKAAERLTDETTDHLADAFESVITGASQMGDALRSLGRSVLETLARMFAEYEARELANTVIGFVAGSGATASEARVRINTTDSRGGPGRTEVVENHYYMPVQLPPQEFRRLMTANADIAVGAAIAAVQRNKRTRDAFGVSR
jgi:hypothetical protein